MQKNIFILWMALILASCNGASVAKIHPIVFFTPKLEIDKNAAAVVLPKAKKAVAWNQGVDWINVQPRNFVATTVDAKFASHNVSQSKMIAAPVISDGKIFTLDEKNKLSAYDVTYKRIWSVALDNVHTKSDSHYKGGMIYNDGKLYLTNSTRELVVVDAKIGVVLWRYTMPDVSKSQPVLYKNIILVMTISNDLYAFDKNTGALLWQNDGLQETLAASRDIAPVVHDGKVLIGYSSGQFVAINANNGEEIWEINLSREGENIPGFIPVSLESQPIVEGQNVYLTSGNGFLFKINLADGQILWQKKIHDIQSMNKAGNTLFVTTNAMQVAAVSEKDGAIVWATNLFVDPKNTSKKLVQLLTPVVINDQLFVGASDGKLYQFAARDGKLTNTIDISKDATYLTVTDSLNIFTGKKILVFK